MKHKIKNPLLACFVGVGILLTGCGPKPDEKIIEKQKTIEEVAAEAVASSVVVYTDDGNGAGWFLDDKGHVMTAYHVVNSNLFVDEKITVKLADGKVYDATIVREDAVTDTAMLYIKGAEGHSFLPWGDSNKLSVGSMVMQVGDPYMQEFTVTYGRISALKRSLIMRPTDLFQYDAATNPGNSGGPVININGEVIGMSDAIIAPASSGSSTGLSFAVSSAAILENLSHPALPVLPKKYPCDGHNC